jgi:hypothetical protein
MFAEHNACFPPFRGVMVMKYSYSKLWSMILFVVTGLVLVACDTTGSKMSADVNDTGVKWTDTDSRLMAEVMVRDVLSSDWLDSFIQSAGKKPVVIVGTVRNLSRESINTDTIVVDVEHEIINSGKVGYIASSTARDELRKEISEKEQHITDAIHRALGEDAGADYMLNGSINSMYDAISGDRVRVYQIDLGLIELSSNRKVWTGQRKIRKMIKK